MHIDTWQKCGFPVCHDHFTNEDIESRNGYFSAFTQIPEEWQKSINVAVCLPSIL